MTSFKYNEHINELQTIWNALVRQDKMPAQADIIVIGGCYDLGLAERAAEIYHSHISKLIVISGYRQAKRNISEAQYLSNRCIELGIPPNALIMEETASNTGENITKAATIVNDLRTNLDSVILIHKPYMSLRFLASAEAQWPKPQPKFYTTCQAITFEKYCKVNGLEDTAWKMLGDFKRMESYVANGYQTAQPISQPAKKAYAELIKSNFVTR